MRVTLWGTRGSIPNAGLDFLRYGGNTPCVEVRGADGTLLVLDAGSGIQRLQAGLEPDVVIVDILLTHLHMDHIQGLGFFRPLYNPDAAVHIWGPPSATQDLQSRLRQYLSAPLFPGSLRDLPCRLSFHDSPRGSFQIGPFEIAADLVCHPGPTVGYRITEGESSMAYLPDHEPAIGVRRFPEEPEWTSGFDLASGVDLLIHDAQYCTGEYDENVGWGHSSVSHAVRFAAMAGVSRLVTFHHDPTHNDEAIDRLVAEVQREEAPVFEFVPGTEGATFEL